MRKFLIFLVSLSIVALLVVGFKSYTLYYYNTNNIDISNKTYLIRKNSKLKGGEKNGLQSKKKKNKKECTRR